MRDLRGALGGSRLFDQPQYRGEVERYHRWLARPGPKFLDVGFDDGRKLLATARENRDWTVIGIEVRKARALQVADLGERMGLDNVLPWRADARTVLANLTPPGSFRVIEILFPTPWWDEDLRADRTLAESSFAADLARALEPGGALVVATDVPFLAEGLAAVLGATPGLVADPAAAAIRPPCSQQSRREWACERDGLPVWRGAWVQGATSA
jgi:tRNA G46 methylase TrmB